MSFIPKLKANWPTIFVKNLTNGSDAVLKEWGNAALIDRIYSVSMSRNGCVQARTRGGTHSFFLSLHPTPDKKA